MNRAPLRALFIASLLMAGCASAAEGQGRVLAVDQVAGFWALTGPGGARCDLSLSNMLIDGVRPVLAERCGIPAAAGAVSWRATADGFELIGRDGRPVMAFRRTGEDAFTASSGGYALTRSPLA